VENRLNKDNPEHYLILFPVGEHTADSDNCEAGNIQLKHKLAMKHQIKNAKIYMNYYKQNNYRYG
jgi:hypothetical protein